MQPAEAAKHAPVPEGPGPTVTALGEATLSLPCWTPQRVELRQWLEDKAPALASVYAAAVQIATDSAFPGRVWFAAHAMREIRNRLPSALAGPTSGSRTEYSALAAEVTRCWTEDDLPADGSPPIVETDDPTASGPARYEVSRDLLVAVGNLVAGDLAIAPRRRENARRLFHALTGGTVPDYVVAAWLNATRRAERYAHLRDKPLRPEDEREFEAVFAAFEEALTAIANKSYQNMDELDEILGSANS